MSNLVAVELPKDKKSLENILAILEEIAEGSAVLPIHQNGDHTTQTAHPSTEVEITETDLSGVSHEFQSAFGEAECHEDHKVIPKGGEK